MTEDGIGAGIQRRRFLRLATIAGCSFGLVACMPAPVPPAPTASPQPLPTTLPTPTATPKPRLSASISFATTSGGVGPHMIPLLVAQELFLKEEGISQKASPFQGGGETVRAIVTGQHQIGHPIPISVAIAVEQGQPVRIIAGNLPFATISWVVRSDSPLQSMKDLKGKKLGFSRAGSVSQTYALAALRALGYTPDTDVKLVAAGGAVEQLSAVQNGVVDAGWLSDPLLTEETLKKTVRTIGRSLDFMPAWSESMLATSVDFARSNADVLEAYLRAHQKAMDYIKNTPEKAADIWARGQGITPEVARAALKGYPLDKLTSRLDPAALKAIGDDMVENRQTKEPPDWRQIVDQGFLPLALRSEI